ncbi:MAG: hypothetical protein HY721_12650 [Planctomycetes bacterium]|nr:hypothetical protein [Planctomycetota bacterium]
MKPPAAGGPLAGLETRIPLEVGGPGKLEVQAIYYSCSNTKTCSVRSVRWDVEVEAAAEGKGEVDVVDDIRP